MPDRQKVIKGLELCTNISQDGCLMLCPYKDEKDETYSGFCEQVLKQDALDLLKEQEAVEPTFKQDNDGIFVWACGSCGAYMYHIYDGIDKAKEYAKYCRQCGKKVKWE